jgi:hypothetical protein
LNQWETTPTIEFGEEKIFLELGKEKIIIHKGR